MNNEGMDVEVAKGKYKGVQGNIVSQNGNLVKIRIYGGGIITVDESDLKK
jgi:ribosomal protein L24